MSCQGCLLALSLVAISVTNVVAQPSSQCVYWASRSGYPRRPCVGSFMYGHDPGNQQQISGCTTIDYQGRYWCSWADSYPTGNDYSQWGLCELDPVTNQPACNTNTYCRIKVNSVQGRGSQFCNFPFTYDGQTYHECTTAGMSDGSRWCSLTPDWNGGDDWGVCPVSASCGQSSYQCRINGGDVYTLPDGFGDQNQKCVFPFYYYGYFYNDCICRDILRGITFERPRCGTTANVNIDGRMGECACLDANGQIRNLLC